MGRPQHNLSTVTKPWGELKPHPDNPRNGDTDAIAESLRVNGQYRPIVITEDGTILAGNHTYAAAGELGWDTLDAVVLAIDPHSTEAKRIMLADNRTADLGRYDDGLLAGLLALLDDAEGGLLGTGYDADDLADLRRLAEPPDYGDLGNQIGEWNPEESIAVTLHVAPDVAQAWGSHRAGFDTDNDALRAVMAALPA